MKKEFLDHLGAVGLTLEYIAEEGWYYANWRNGLVPEQLKAAVQAHIDFLQVQPCAKVLNDNSHLEIPWQQVNDWFSKEWAPRAVGLGMRYFAHVVSPKLSGKLSIVDLDRRIHDQVTVRVFQEVEKAQEWLRSCPDSISQALLPVV